MSRHIRCSIAFENSRTGWTSHLCTSKLLSPLYRPASLSLVLGWMIMRKPELSVGRVRVVLHFSDEAVVSSRAYQEWHCSLPGRQV